MPRQPRTKPRTGKRKYQSAGRINYCRQHPEDPSCYYPGKGDEFVNELTGARVRPGCIRGMRATAGNPPDCDFRRVTRDTPGLTAATRMRYFFNRARIQYAASQSNLAQYSPFVLDASGWPDVRGLTQNQCQRPTPALLDELNVTIEPEWRAQGVHIWVPARGETRIKCNKWGLPELAFPPNVDRGFMRYFYMGIGYAYAAANNLIRALNLLQANPAQLAPYLNTDENTVAQEAARQQLGENAPITEWRALLKRLRPTMTRTEPLPPIALEAQREDLQTQIQEAAAAAAEASLRE